MSGRIEKRHKYQAAILNSEITMPVSGDAAYNKLKEVFVALDTASVKNWIPAATAEVKMAQFEIDGALWEIDPGGVVSNPAYGMYIAPKDGDLVAIGLKKVGGTEIITLCAARTGGDRVWPAVTADGDIHVLRATTTVLKNPPSTLKWVPKALHIISKPFLLIQPSTKTQYRNAAITTVTRTITTYNSGYTRSKNGWATANFPGPGTGEEYVRVVRGPWINNGACYDSARLNGFGAHSAPSVTARRSTGSSCHNTNFTAALEVEVRTTKRTAWHDTQAAADAEFTGTTETRAVAVPGKKLKKIVKGDPFPFTSSLEVSSGTLDLHNSDQYLYMPSLSKGNINKNTWWHFNNVGFRAIIDKYKTQPSAGFYYIYASNGGAPAYIDLHTLVDKMHGNCIFKQLEAKGELNNIKQIHFNSGTKTTSDAAHLNWRIHDFVVEMNNGKWYLCHDDTIVEEKVFPRELTFETITNLLGTQDVNSYVAPTVTDGFKRVGCLWYPGALPGQYNRPVGYGRHYWPTALEYQRPGSFGGANPSYTGPIKEGQIVRMKVSSFRVPDTYYLYNKQGLNQPGGVYETVIFWKMQGGQHYFRFSSSGCRRQDNGGDRLGDAHTGHYGKNGLNTWRSWNSMDKYHGWVELYTHWITGGRSVQPSIALNGDSLYLGGWCEGLSDENLTFFIVDMVRATGNDVDAFDGYVETHVGRN